jgi:hypothetical protein
MNRRWIVFVFLVTMLTSCNLPNQPFGTPPASHLPVADTVSSSLSTPTRVPIETLLALPTPTFVPTSTPRLALVSPISQPVNCRYGPSTAFAVVGGLDLGRQAEIVGKNIDVTWWYVKNPSDPSTFCWLLADLVNAVGRVDSLPVVEVPLAQVTNIQLRVEPPSLNVSCTAFPQYVIVNADITTNGPATVTWRWETSEAETIGANPILFLETSSQSDFLYYKVTAAKDYWIQVHILSPNDITGRVIFKATCTP